MSDLRARLADALRKHYFWWPNHSSIGSEAHCQCGKRPRDWSYWADHATDVLLSLPGIAVVELPDKPPGKPFWPTRASNSWTGDDYESFVDATPGSGVVQTAIFQYTVEQARDLAAAFLAAANAAEEKP